MKNIILSFSIFICINSILYSQGYDLPVKNYYLGELKNKSSSPDKFIHDITDTIEGLLAYKLYFTKSAINREFVVKDMQALNAVTDLGLRGDGVTDNTKALQAALDSAYLSSRKIYFPKGVYLTGSLKANYSINFAGDGENSILKFKSHSVDNSQLLQVYDGKKQANFSIKLQNIAFYGNAEGNTGNHFNTILRVQNCKNIYINNVQFRGAVEKNVELLYDSSVFITNSFFDTSGRVSISTSKSQDIYFVGNVLKGWSSQSLNLYPAYASIVPNYKQFIYLNRFKNTIASSEFCIEFFHYGTDDSSIIAYNSFEHVNGLDTSDNETGNDKMTAGGIGLSGLFSNSIIYKNKFINTDLHLGGRSGMELTCMNTVIIGNEITNGEISLCSNRFFRNVNNNLIADNNIKFKNGTGAVFLLYSDNDVQDSIRNLTVYGNDFNFSTNKFHHNQGLRFGLNSKFTLQNIYIANNTITGNGDNVGIFYQDGAYYLAKNILIERNNISQSSIGIQDHNGKELHENFLLRKNNFKGVLNSYDVQDEKLIK